MDYFSIWTVWFKTQSVKGVGMGGTVDYDQLLLLPERPYALGHAWPSFACTTKTAGCGCRLRHFDTGTKTMDWDITHSGEKDEKNK